MKPGPDGHEPPKNISQSEGCHSILELIMKIWLFLAMIWAGTKKNDE